MSENTTRSERLKLRAFLKHHLDNKSVFGLEWVVPQEQTFKIIWVHQGNSMWKDNEGNYGQIFMEWARNGGKYRGEGPLNYTDWKSMFRNALHKADDIVLVEKSPKEEVPYPYRIYQFAEPKGKKKKGYVSPKDLEKISRQTNEGSQAGTVRDQSPFLPSVVEHYKSSDFSGTSFSPPQTVPDLQNMNTYSPSDLEQSPYGGSDSSSVVSPDSANTQNAAEHVEGNEPISDLSGIEAFIEEIQTCGVDQTNDFNNFNPNTSGQQPTRSNNVLNFVQAVTSSSSYVPNENVLSLPREVQEWIVTNNQNPSQPPVIETSDAAPNVSQIINQGLSHNQQNSVVTPLQSNFSQVHMASCSEQGMMANINPSSQPYQSPQSDRLPDSSPSFVPMSNENQTMDFSEDMDIDRLVNSPDVLQDLISNISNIMDGNTQAVQLSPEVLEAANIGTVASSSAQNDGNVQHMTSSSFESNTVSSTQGQQISYAKFCPETPIEHYCNTQNGCNMFVELIYANHVVAKWPVDEEMGCSLFHKRSIDDIALPADIPLNILYGPHHDLQMPCQMPPWPAEIHVKNPSKIETLLYSMTRGIVLQSDHGNINAIRLCKLDIYYGLCDVGKPLQLTKLHRSQDEQKILPYKTMFNYERDFKPAFEEFKDKGIRKPPTGVYIIIGQKHEDISRLLIIVRVTSCRALAEMQNYRKDDTSLSLQMEPSGDFDRLADHIAKVTISANK